MCCMCCYGVAAGAVTYLLEDATVTYTVTLTNDNAGPALTGVTFQTNLTSASTVTCNNGTSMAANGGQLTCSFVYTVTQGDKDAGHLPDVTVTAKDSNEVVLVTKVSSGASHLVLNQQLGEAMVVTIGTSAEACTTPTAAGASKWRGME